ncbi:hypothetical protein RRF57_011681 [Xylaria bambusicola]|uniref:Uncharacterized protein n=1 Tax=Xylaria bambusicola TaxID=326684 RepID=A0AAN7V305_9PEZI
MSRARFFRYASSSPSTAAVPSLGRTKAISEGQWNESKRVGRSGREMGGENRDVLNELFVGVCIFRLDRETLRPAVLLIRYEPRGRGCVLTTAKNRCEEARREKQGQNQRRTRAVGEWELPGGKVADDDFCISAAVNRLVRSTLGLKVTKIMVMLSSIEWSAEVKVLLWRKGASNGDEEGGGSEGDDEGFGSSSTDYTDGDDGRGKSEEVQTQIANQVNSSGHGGWNSDSTSVSMSVYSTDEQVGRGGDGQDLGERVTLSALGRDLSGNYQGSLPSSPWTLVRPLSSSDPDPDFDSCSIPPPPLPPRHYGRGHDYTQEHSASSSNNNNKNNSNKNNSRNNNIFMYLYDSGSDHDPSLEPAPLSIPRKPVAVTTRTTTTTTTTTTMSVRTEKEKGGKGNNGKDSNSPFCARGRSNTASSTTLSLYDDFNIGRERMRTRARSSSRGGGRGREESGERGGINEEGVKKHKAQMVPCKVVQRTCMQLNFGVIVDEGSGGIGGSPGEDNDENDGDDDDDDDDDDDRMKRKVGKGGEEGEKMNQEERLGVGGREVGDVGNDRRIRIRRRRGREGTGRENRSDVFFEWATCARVREMDMSEDLRTVVLEGLDWMAELNGRFF